MDRSLSRGGNIEQDGLGDWRLQAVTRLTDDLAAAFPGGPSFKAGSSICLTTRVCLSKDEWTRFSTPSASALALSSSFRLAERAVQLWTQVAWTQVITPDGPGRVVSSHSVSLLFDYFESSLASAMSGFQAVEAFANEAIGRFLKGKIVVTRYDKKGAMGADEIERKLSTSEKLATVLPEILGSLSIKKTPEWELFNDLKKLRDSATHFKSDDQYPLKAGASQSGSVYHSLLTKGPMEYPISSVRILLRILPRQHEKPRWLMYLAQKHGISMPLD